MMRMWNVRGTIQTGSVKKDIWLNIVISTCGVTYSILIEEYPLLTGEAIVLVLSIWLTILYVMYRKNTKQLKNLPAETPSQNVTPRVTAV